MRKHITNASYGVLDYISYPLGMLLVAPVVLHKLGAAEYGLWMISTAVISAGSIVASGFCDACIQRVAWLRGTDELHLAPAAVRSAMGINLALGALFAAFAWIAAPFVASHVAVSNLIPRSECLVVLRIASVAILVRTMESVAVGVQRAFEQYRATVQISTLMRFLTLAAAAVLVLLGKGTISILLATLVFLALGVVAQFRASSKLLAGVSFWPRFHPTEAPHLFRQGSFVWLQTLGGVVFGQLDRIFLGISLGALAVTPYSLCVQFAHPIYGLSASGFNFLFPYLSSRAGATPRQDMKRVVRKAFVCNLVIVACSAGLLLLFGHSLIRVWAGPAVAESAKSILPPIVIGAALMGAKRHRHLRPPGARRVSFCRIHHARRPFGNAPAHDLDAAPQRPAGVGGVASLLRCRRARRLSAPSADSVAENRNRPTRAASRFASGHFLLGHAN